MKCFLCCNEMFQASKSKWMYILDSSQYILLNFYKREPFCNSRYGIRITHLQFTNDLSIFEQLNSPFITNWSPPHIRKTNVIFTYFQKYYSFFFITISISQIIIPLSKVQPHPPHCSNGGWKFHFGQSHWHRLHMKI